MANPLNKSAKAQIRKQLNTDRQLAMQAQTFLRKQFKLIHSKLINDFESHPVTRELRGGSTATNLTGLLPEGNLFGFIGFASETDPISDIESMIRSIDIMLKKRKLGMNGFIWTYTVTVPPLRQFYHATPMPWAAGSSWLRELEGRGIPNLGQYMFNKSMASRSGAGTQNKNRLPGRRVKTPYVKRLLEVFEKNLNNMQASRVPIAYF